MFINWDEKSISDNLDMYINQIEELEKTSGYTIEELTELFLNKRVIINQDSAQKRKL